MVAWSFNLGSGAPNLVHKGTLPLVKYDKGELGPFRVTYYSRLGLRV
jgi:hypothetical protein